VKFFSLLFREPPRRRAPIFLTLDPHPFFLSSLASLLFLSPTSTSLSQAKVKSVERIVGPKATGETMHIVIETEGKIPFWEGQSYGVIPPGEFRVFFPLFFVFFALFLSLSLSLSLFVLLPRLWTPSRPLLLRMLRIFCFRASQNGKKKKTRISPSFSTSKKQKTPLSKTKKQEPRSTPRGKRSATASASTPSPPPATATSSTARPPPSACAAPPTGAPS